jgi:hypothetical protein
MELLGAWKGSSSWSYSVSLVEAGKYRLPVSYWMFVLTHSFAVYSRVGDSLQKNAKYESISTLVAVQIDWILDCAVRLWDFFWCESCRAIWSTNILVRYMSGTVFRVEYSLMPRTYCAWSATMSFRSAFPKTRILNKSVGRYCVDLREAGSVDKQEAIRSVVTSHWWNNDQCSELKQSSWISNRRNN